MVNAKVLREKGLLNGPSRPLKLLGMGSLTKKISVSVNKISVSARAAVEKVGGSVEVKEI